MKRLERQERRGGGHARQRGQPKASVRTCRIVSAVCVWAARERGASVGPHRALSARGLGGSVGWEEWGLSHVQVLLSQLSHLSVSGLDTAVPTTLCGNQGGTYLLALCGIRDHGEPYERQGHEASEPEVLLGSERKSLAGPAELLLPSDPCLVVAGPPIN